MKIKTHSKTNGNTTETVFDGVQFSTDEKILIGLTAVAFLFFAGMAHGAITRAGMRTVMNTFQLDVKFPQLPHGAILTPLTEAGENVVKDVVLGLV